MPEVEALGGDPEGREGRPKLCEERPRVGRASLVLQSDVRLVPLPVLGREPGRPSDRKRPAEAREVLGFERVGDSTAERAQAGRRQAEL
jgi:hypothetical protein